MVSHHAIAELLATHSYVSLPGLGSFVQTYQPARLSPDGREYLPPRQQVTFDPQRRFNDQALEQHLAHTLGLSAAEAEREVTTWLQLLRERLDRGQRIRFAGIGTLQRDAAGELRLMALGPGEQATDTFGLGPLAVAPPLSAAAQPPPIPSPDPWAPAAHGRQGGRRQVLLALATALLLIAAAAGGLMIYKPGLIPSILAPAPPAEVPPAPQDPRADREGMASRPPADSPAQPPANSRVVAQGLPPADTLARQAPAYYIISSSFLTLANAQAHRDALAQQGHSPQILAANGKYRVALSRFTDLNQALGELNRLRAQGHQQVWLLGP